MEIYRLQGSSRARDGECCKTYFKVNITDAQSRVSFKSFFHYCAQDKGLIRTSSFSESSLFFSENSFDSLSQPLQQNSKKIYSRTDRRLMPLLLPHEDASPFLGNFAMMSFFHASGTFTSHALLKSSSSANALLVWPAFNLSAVILSSPGALFPFDWWLRYLLPGDVFSFHSYLEACILYDSFILWVWSIKCLFEVFCPPVELIFFFRLHFPHSHP